MGAGSIAMLGGTSPGHWDSHRAPVMSTSSHHPTGTPKRKSDVPGRELRHRGIDISIAQTITTFETYPGAITFTTQAAANSHVLDRHMRTRVASSN